MNTKIPEKQIEKKNIKQTARVIDKVIMPGPAYFIVLTVTIILLLSFTVAFFAVFANQVSGNNDISNDTPKNDFTDTPSNPTIPKKSNYLSKSASGVELIGNQVNSDNVILVELGNNESIVEKGADEIIYPASMTKVMTVLVVCEYVKNFNKTLTLQQKTINYAYETGGSQFGLQRGEEVTIKDLLYLTSYWSDTVATITLAEHVAGSEAEFAKLMNKKAKAIGLKNTNFDNATGLHSEDNYSTCREIAAIFAYALDNSFCREILTSTQPYKFTTNKGSYTLSSPSWYRQRVANKPVLDTVTVKGGKTGFIDESGYCLVSYAVGQSERRYIQVVIGDKMTVVDDRNKIWYSKDVKYVYNTYAN